MPAADGGGGWADGWVDAGAGDADCVGRGDWVAACAVGRAVVSGHGGVESGGVCVGVHADECECGAVGGELDCGVACAVGFAGAVLFRGGGFHGECDSVCAWCTGVCVGGDGSGVDVIPAEYVDVAAGEFDWGAADCVECGSGGDGDGGCGADVGAELFLPDGGYDGGGSGGDFVGGLAVTAFHGGAAGECGGERADGGS